MPSACTCSEVQTVAFIRAPDVIARFALERFYTDILVSELAPAAVSH